MKGEETKGKVVTPQTVDLSDIDSLTIMRGRFKLLFGLQKRNDLLCRILLTPFIEKLRHFGVKY